MIDSTPALQRVPVAGIALFACLAFAACGNDSDRSLWERRFAAPAVPEAAGSTQLTGYWEGQVFSGGVRLAIEPDRVTLALKCDSAGKKVAQATARVAVDGSGPATLTLQDDLAGGDVDCGFKFVKGDRLTVRPGGPGVIEVAFGNASVAQLAKLADLAPAH